MLMDIRFWKLEEYLPTKRHRKLRKRWVPAMVTVDILELNKQDFPLAFIVHESGYVYTDSGCVWTKDIAQEVRFYDGQFWKAVRQSENVSHASGWMPPSYIAGRIYNYEPYFKGGDDFKECSIVKKSSEDEEKENIILRSKGYIVCDDKVWVPCSEPMYVINTFGLGHNHGGTGFFIDWYYNPNIPSQNYFTALEREKAITYGKEVAIARGDTASVDMLGANHYIEVLLPDLVTRNPRIEHSNSEELYNTMESLIQGSDSIIESGFLVIAQTLKCLR